MKYYSLFLCLILLTISFSCAVKQTKTLTQGIKGQVTAIEGDLMPGPGKKQDMPKGVKRTIFIYEVLRATELDGQGPLYATIPARLVKQINTDTAGNFQCKMKAGRYSVLTKEDGQFFSGLSNEMGELSPVEVLPDSIVTCNILINYKAVY